MFLFPRAFHRNSASFLCLRPVAACVGAMMLLATMTTGCGSGPLAAPALAKDSGDIKLEGQVHGGQQPIVGASVQLYAAGTTGDQSTATALIGNPPILTGAAGDFSITGRYTCPSITAEVYLIASGGNPGLGLGINSNSVLMSALGPCGNLTSATHIVINEVSTIGSIYPITPFMSSYLNVGSSTSDFNTLAADFMQINQFINTDGGQSPGPALPGGFSAPVTNLYTLANAMSACVNSSGGVAGDGSNCGKLFLYAKPPTSAAPTNTADAILDIANNPTQNVTSIFNLSTAVPAFQPSLSAAPADWTLKILPNITLATPSNLVGVGSTNTGTITLGQAAPAGGLSVALVSSNTSFVTVLTPAGIAAGSTTGTFSYTGVAAGTATITATGTGYVSSSVTLSATSSLISLGTIPTVAPGQAVDLPLSLGTPAPAGGIDIHFSSVNGGVATISPAVVNIPAGLKVPSANPKVTGVTVGSTTINATATGYAPGAQNVTVSVTASLPSTVTIPLSSPTNVTLTISAPAPAGGIQFSLSSDNTGVFTVATPVTIAAGATTANAVITGVAMGTSTLRADSPGIAEATSSITVNSTISLQTNALTTGTKLQTGSYFYFAAAPPSAVTATITSGSPSVAVVSNSATSVGATSTTITGITSTSASTYYVQGIAAGSSVLTISAPGYASTTVSVTVDPSGFVIYTPGSISSTTLSSDSSVTIASAILNPSTSAVLGYAAISPGVSVNVPVASSSTTVGTITNSPVAFTVNTSTNTANFHPVGAGSTTLSVSTPAGFTTPLASTTQITATVTAPPINVQTSTITTGAGLEVSTYAYLSQTPLSPTTVTITSSAPGVAVVSNSATTAGSTTATVSAVVSTGAFTYYIQGVSAGSATITISASPYSSNTVNVTVDPSGFVIYTPGSISTTSLSSATSLTIVPAILNPSTLTVLGYAAVSPLLSSVSVPITSSSTSVGTIGTSPVVFHGGDSSQTSTFQPVSAGTSTISISTPTSFSTPPTSTTQITATVTAPPISLQTTALTTGVNLEVSSYAYLSQTPTAPVTITITSGTPSVATVSNSATIAGAASVTFPNTVSTSSASFYVQGLAVGASTLTISAPGYSSATISVTVDPSGFVIYTPGSFSTTTFSPSTSVTLAPAILNLSGTVIGYAQLNPGISNVSVPMNSSATQVGTITSPVVFHAGDSSQSATFQPVAAGSATITLTQPAGYSTPSSSTQITATVTAPPISLQTASLTTGTNLEVSTYAYLSQTPPSAVTLTLTSNNTSIATISSSATAGGAATLTYNNQTSTSSQTFYVQGHATGTTTITLSAAGYSNATINVTVDPSGFVIYTPGNFSTTTFSTSSSITIAPAILTPGTFTVLGYATLSPGTGSVSIPIASSTTSVGTVTSPIVFNAGDSSDAAMFQPSSAGTTNLTLTTPSGFSTPAPASTQQITATVTAPPISVQTTTLTTGVNLEVSTYFYLSQTPPATVTATVTSSSPSVAILSKTATAVGGSSLSYSLSNTSSGTYYVQGLATGTSTLTISAPGFTSATITVTVDPSGFVIYNPGNFSTTTFSSTTAITAAAAILSPGTLTVLGYAALSPGIGSVSVPIASSTTSVGTITSPIVFNVGDTSDSANFQPSSAGTTNLTLSTPAGFTTPSQSSTQAITATVTAPPISTQSSSITTGANLQVSTYAYLSTAPPSAVNLTITSNSPSVATVSTSATTVGSTSIVYNGVTGTSAMTYYIQGQSAGTATLTLSAPGFMSTTVTVTVGVSGFVVYSPGNFNTTTTSGNTTVTVVPAILNTGVLTVAGYGTLNPGLGTVSVPMGSTSPQIGTISATSLSFTAGSSAATTNFTPLASGSTNIIIISQPNGFTTPSQPSTQQIVATVQ